MLNKYYIGAKHIGAAISRGGEASCTRRTVDEAIDDARQAVQNNEAECIVVVKIVAIVRKQRPPIEVEWVE